MKSIKTGIETVNVTAGNGGRAREGLTTEIASICLINDERYDALKREIKTAVATLGTAIMVFQIIVKILGV